MPLKRLVLSRADTLKRCCLNNSSAMVSPARNRLQKPCESTLCCSEGLTKWRRTESTFGEMLLGGDLSSQCLSETHDTRRLRICRPQVLGEKCDPSVIAEIPVSWPPINGSELTKKHRPQLAKHPARYRPGRRIIFQIRILCRIIGHPSVLRSDHDECQPTHTLHSRTRSGATKTTSFLR